MHLRMLIVLTLCALMAWPGQAQPSEIIPTDFVPLEVGNQWTYKHTYFNRSYMGGWRDKSSENRRLFEIPGYPYDNLGDPPDSLSYAERELTIEITHTEMIDGLEYFVFSRADYDWPPIPTLFWAGQKVRLSDEGVLLFRWNGQDVPLYDLNLQHPDRYSIPAYPTSIREDIVTKLDMRRWNRDERDIEFTFDYPKINLVNLGLVKLPIVFFLSGYGLTYQEDYYQGGFSLFSLFFNQEGLGGLSLFFSNKLDAISAIILGEAVSFEQVLRGNTHVQPSTWGQLKRVFRSR